MATFIAQTTEELMDKISAWYAARGVQVEIEIDRKLTGNNQPGWLQLSAAGEVARVTPKYESWRNDYYANPTNRPLPESELGRMIVEIDAKDWHPAPTPKYVARH